MPPVVPIAFLTAETLTWTCSYLLDPKQDQLEHIQQTKPDAAVLLDWIAENMIADKFKPIGEYPHAGLPADWESYLVSVAPNMEYLSYVAAGFLCVPAAQMLKYLEDYLPPVPTE